jgi:hypothetical protein
MLSFAKDRGWEILDLSSSATVDATIREVSDCPIEDSFDGLDCGVDYLSVIHLSFGCDPRIFELVDYLVSKTFDLPTCVVTVEYRQGRKAFFESVTEATDPAKQLLKAIRVTRRHEMHENTTETLNQLKQFNPRFAQMEFRITRENKEHPNLLPGANLQMLAEDLGQLRQAKDIPNTWAQATKNGWKDPQSYETEFLKQNPLADYVKRERERIGPLKGMEGKGSAPAAAKSPLTPQQIIEAEVRKRGLIPNAAK